MDGWAVCAGVLFFLLSVTKAAALTYCLSPASMCCVVSGVASEVISVGRECSGVCGVYVLACCVVCCRHARGWRLARLVERGTAAAPG